MTGMTPAQVAAHDQAEAKERQFDSRAQKVGAWVLIVGLGLGAYSAFAVAGDVPAPPWAPISQNTDTPPPTPFTPVKDEPPSVSV